MVLKFEMVQASKSDNCSSYTGKMGFVPQSVHPSMECMMCNDAVELSKEVSHGQIEQ